MFRCAGALRFMIAPPPRWLSIYVSCGGIIAMSGWHNPEVAFEPKYAPPIADPVPPPRIRTIGSRIYDVNASTHRQSHPKPERGEQLRLDNVFVERLWRSLKYEEVYLHAYEDLREARIGIGRYFSFYNELRPHTALGAQTPAAFYAWGLPRSAA